MEQTCTNISYHAFLVWGTGVYCIMAYYSCVRKNTFPTKQCLRVLVFLPAQGGNVLTQKCAGLWQLFLSVQGVHPRRGSVCHLPLAGRISQCGARCVQTKHGSLRARGCFVESLLKLALSQPAFLIATGLKQWCQCKDSVTLKRALPRPC